MQLPSGIDNAITETHENIIAIKSISFSENPFELMVLRNRLRCFGFALQARVILF